MYDISPEDYLKRYQNERNLRNGPDLEFLKKKKSPKRVTGFQVSWSFFSELFSIFRKKYCEDDLGVLSASPC